jgi:hypothetical protein
MAVMNVPHSSTGKENNSLHFLVVKEIVKGPQTSLFTIRIRVQVWVVTEMK